MSHSPLRIGRPRTFAHAPVAAAAVALAATALADLPETFDLRSTGGASYVTPVKSQSGGTCWTHGIMAAMESNLLMTGVWNDMAEGGVPDLAEYHLDWWNGFNDHCNDDVDPPTGTGLTVHQGGDYLVGSAYFARLEGAVRDVDGQSYVDPPIRHDDSYHYYYPRHIEWHNLGSGLDNIDTIKSAVMAYGAMGTCMCSSGQFITEDGVHYQPSWSTLDPNHAIAIIGWDDDFQTQASQPGAWLCKNSWGSYWNDGGYFWISYYDKHAGRHPEMGAVSFVDVEPVQYDRAYFHDYHGWRDELDGVTEAFNAFTFQGEENDLERLAAVNFFTSTENVAYTARIYDRFEAGELQDVLAEVSGTFAYRGFHTVDLPQLLALPAGDDFYVYLQLSDGGHPYDRTSEVPVLLGARSRVIVPSSASREQSYYREGGQWRDLNDLDDTANFCIKALSRIEPYLTAQLDAEPPRVVRPGIPHTVAANITEELGQLAIDGAQLWYRFDGGSFTAIPMQHVDGDLYEAAIPGAGCEDEPEFYVAATDVDGHLVTAPAGAPQEAFDYAVGEDSELMQFNGDFNPGWTVTGDVINGAWEYVDGGLVSTPGAPPTDFDGNGGCWVTQNRSYNSDVTGGATMLFTNPVSLSGLDLRVEFAVWFTNHLGPKPWDDVLEVYVRTDGSTWHLAHTEGPSCDEEWNVRSFEVNEVAPPGPWLELRFVASDEDNSIVEAAIDDVRIYAITCEDACVGDVNGSGQVDADDLFALLGEWGACSGCAADLDQSGAVDADDLFALLGAWGSCPQ